MSHNHRYHQARSITLIGALSNAFLGGIKFFGGISFHSHGLVADGLHSFADLIADFMVLWASKYGNHAADDSHPYGHQRFETAATLFLALLLIITGLGIAWDSGQHLLLHEAEPPKAFALGIAIFSVVANEVLFYLTHRVGKEIKSALIEANAWHHRSDSAASLVVLLGIIGGLYGLPYIDSIAAIVVGCLIVKMGIDYAWNSVKELVDTSVEPAQIEAIIQVINQIDGVVKIHQLRNRKMGADLLIDVHIMVLPWISVSEGHQIAQRVHSNLMSQIKEIRDVVVHVDPEDDEINPTSQNLPSRVELEQVFLHHWTAAFPAIKRILLHYLEGKIMIELYLEPGFKQLVSLRKKIQKDLQSEPMIDGVRFFLEKT